jgi:polysaccharide export outer membrane protein
MRPAVLSLLCGCLAAQIKTGAVPDPGGANLPAQKIGANDLIAVAVYGAPELTRTVRVSSEGTVRLPMLKRRIKAEGLWPAELESILTEALSAEEILVDPVVTVTMVEYTSRPISVAGAVRRPVTFQAYGKTTLLEALTRAEGLAPTAGGEILVSRGTETLRIGAKGLFEGSDAGANIQLSGGEEIRVPEVGRVFVVGNVKRPGAYPLNDPFGTTVLKALALSEGLAPFATRDAYLYRTKANGREEKTIALRKILDRKAPDVALEANDILYIPDNRRGRATLTAIERAVAFGTATASGALVLSVNR